MCKDEYANDFVESLTSTHWIVLSSWNNIINWWMNICRGLNKELSVIHISTESKDVFTLHGCEDCVATSQKLSNMYHPVVKINLNKAKYCYDDVANIFYQTHYKRF